MSGITRRSWFALATGGPLAGVFLARHIRKVKRSRPGGFRAGYFPNVVLRTHENEAVRFYDDLLKDKVAVINFMYARCEGICPSVMSNLVQVQRILGERVGRDIFMYSITLKPKEDTPEVLKRYAQMHGVQPGWQFLTGRPTDIELIRRKLGAVDPDPAVDADTSNHIGLLRYGNEALERWTACAGQATPAWIVRSILSVSARIILLLLTLFVMVTPAAAQGQWELEFHGGVLLSNRPADGIATLPAAGTPFTTVSGVPSRRESSWYFGDGAALVNQVNTARGVSPKITPLDPVLNRSVAQRQNGASFGFRISRHITPRYTAEFSVDYSRGQLEMSDSGRAGIEASRDSFISAFNVPFPPGPAGIAPVVTVTSTDAIDEQRGHQVFATGVLNINLKGDGRIIPYATVGGGVVVNAGNTPSATLAGTYRVAPPSGGPLPAGVLIHDETDTVTLRYSIERRALVGVLGGGIKYVVSPRWGVRLDIRALLSNNSISNLVDANATVATLTPASVLVIPANPTLQFSNNPSTGAPSSLSGPPINGFQTFAGSGIQAHISIVPGVFWRF